VYRALDWKGLVSVLAGQRAIHGGGRDQSSARVLFNSCSRPSRYRRVSAEWFLSLDLAPSDSSSREPRLLVLGCLLDTTTLLPLLVPLLLPIARALGVDLVHFGVVIRPQHEIGLFTPAFTECSSRAERLAATPVKEIVRELCVHPRADRGASSSSYFKSWGSLGFHQPSAS